LGKNGVVEQGHGTEAVTTSRASTMCKELAVAQRHGTTEGTIVARQEAFPAARLGQSWPGCHATGSSRHA
jgi:hypothetical protein